MDTVFDVIRAHPDGITIKEISMILKITEPSVRSNVVRLSRWMNIRRERIQSITKVNGSYAYKYYYEGIY